VRDWDLTIALDRNDGTPLFLAVARAIAAAIRKRRLRPGARLPGSRTLARTLAVHRNTVLAAYEELAAEGFVSTTPARGTFVTTSLADRHPLGLLPSRERADSGPPTKARYELGTQHTEPDRWVWEYPAGTLALTAFPDLRLLPSGALARAYRRALRHGGPALLGYADPRGYPGLRTALAVMLSTTRGLSATEDQIVVTRGSQMALALLAHALGPPDGVIAVEAYGYRAAWEAFRLAGVELVPLPVDDEGVQVEALERLVSRRRVRAVYVTPHHQYPTTVTLSAARRRTLLELASAARLAIIEDDYDHEFQYEGHPVLPLASADRYGTVIYLGSLSKVLAPGLRIGFVVAPTPVVERLAAHRWAVEVCGDHLLEHALASLFESSELQRHGRRMRRLYRTRRDALVAALHHELGDALAFRVPRGGLGLWCRVARGIKVEGWAVRARERGVLVQTGRRFAFDGRPRPYVRLGFTALTPDELAQAAYRLARAL